MLYSTVNTDTDKISLVLRPLCIIPLMYNADNKAKEKRRTSGIFIRCEASCAVVSALGCIQSSGTRRNFLKHDSNVYFHLLKIIIYNTFQNCSHISQDFLVFLPSYSTSHSCSLVSPGNLSSASLEHLLWRYFCSLLTLSHM